MTLKSILVATSAAILLTACGNNEAAQEAVSSAVGDANEVIASVDHSAQLANVLAAQPDKVKARYAARNPQATLEFFGIKPGMNVAEALPGGGGWYSKILIPYLGAEGRLTGMDYSIKMWPEFGGFATPEFIETKKTWAEDWAKEANTWSPDGAPVDATTFGRVGDAQAGQYDAVLFIRALHNLSRFEDEGEFLTEALSDAHTMLKPGGLVGVVQHQGPEGNEDKWAEGDNGYLKKSTLIAQFKTAGFDLVAESNINENPKDMPTNEDMVWRLPPTLGTSKDNPELKAKMEAIGETNRMTLLFAKR